MSRETCRYTRDGSSVPGGSICYDNDLILHTHSDTAPTRGQLHAFDLTRIEKFGTLDKDCPADTPMAQRPSYLAMAELMATLPEIQVQRASAEFVDLGPVPAADDSWLDAPAPQRKRFQKWGAAEFMRQPPMEWIIPGILPRAELVFVLGKPGAGKTFFSLDMACAITRGVDWCGRGVRKGRAVYVVLEGATGFAGRLRAYSNAHDVDPGELPEIISDAPNLLESGDVKALAEQISAADVILIDTLACAHGGDENSGPDMGRVVRAAKHLHKVTGAVVVFLHHPPHEGDRIRGHSSMTGAADAILTITKQGDGAAAIRSAATSKLKDGIEGPLFNFKITGEGLFEHVGGVVAARAAKLPKPGTKIRASLDAIKAEIVKQGGAPIHLQDARAAIVATKSEPEPGKVDRRGSRAGDDIDALVNQGLLFRVDGKLSDTQLVKGDSSENF